jgi:Fur family peroxide stress response transcriptional regulator
MHSRTKKRPNGLQNESGGVFLRTSNHSYLELAMPSDVEQLDLRMQNFADVCRCKGLKTTHQRTEIYRELAGTVEHPDAETIYMRLRPRIAGISLDTVYRTLRLFEEEGIVSRVGLVGARARYDANVREHPHFVCRRCGAMCDVALLKLGGLESSPALEQVGQVDTVSIELRGVCRACLEADKG